MKKLFYRLSSRRPFVKLFLILACVALPSLFAQQAVAQEDLLGWVPDCAPNCPADGDWDAHLTCGAVQGLTTITHNPPSGSSVLQQGTVDCTFTDTARTCTPGTLNCSSTGVFQETAQCSLTIQFANLSETCTPNPDDGTSTLTVTGMCPSQQGQKQSGAIGSGGTIDCRGKPNPTFCTYQGTNPVGNTTGDCRWNIGFGKLQGSNVVSLSPNNCTDLFASPIFSYTQTYAGQTCSGRFASLGEMAQQSCHSDTWNGKTLATCDVQNTGGPKNSATGVVVNHLTVDTTYNQNTVNATCVNITNSGKITFSALANPKQTDQHQVPIVLENIDQGTITVNGFPVIPGTCTSPTVGMTTLTCQVNKCTLDGHNIIENTISSNGKTATLTMKAQMFNETFVTGDVVTVQVSKTP